MRIICRVLFGTLHLATWQLRSSEAQKHGNPAGQIPTKKKRAVAAAQQPGSPAAWQLSTKETTAQQLSRTGDLGYTVKYTPLTFRSFLGLCPRELLQASISF